MRDATCSLDGLIAVLVQPHLQPRLTLYFVQAVFSFLNPVTVRLADFVGRRAHHVGHVVNMHTSRKPLGDSVMSEAMRSRLDTCILDGLFDPLTPLRICAGERRFAQSLKPLR